MNKKLTKHIVITALVAICLISASPLFLYGYYYVKWDDIYNKSELIEIAEEINSTNELPSRFYDLYEKVFPEYKSRGLITNIYRSLFSLFIGPRKTEVPFSKAPFSLKTAVYMDISLMPNKRVLSSDLCIAIALEDLSSNKKCFDYFHKLIGIDDMARKLFQKPMKQLSDNEMIELIIYSQWPGFYDRRPELFQEEIERINNKIAGA